MTSAVHIWQLRCLKDPLIISDINEGSESSEHQIQSQIHRLRNKHT